MEAARVLSGRKLYRREIAEALFQLMASESAEVRLTACLALAQLRSFYAAPALVEALSEGGETVRASAHRALEELSGRKLPARDEAWRRWLGRG